MPRPKSVDLAGVKKVLVCMFKFHGDVLLISSFLTALKNNLSHVQIDCMIFDQTKDMLEGHHCIDQLILYKKKKSVFRRLVYDVTQFFKIRKKGYDLAFNMSQGDRGALYCLASGAKIRVGFDSLGKGFMKKNSIFTHLVARNKALRHVVDINLDPLRIIGIHPANQEDKKLHLTISDQVRLNIDLLLKKQNLEHGEFVVFHTMSRYEHKHWPSKKWTQLIECFQERGIKVVLTGSSELAQKAYVDEILKPLKDRIGVYNFCGQTSLKGLAGLIDASRLLVTIDSVPLHMSSALKKPVVALFGPSIEQKWGPYQNPNSRIVAMNLACRSCDLEGCSNTWVSECMQNLQVDKVKDAAFSLLECKAFA